MALYKPMLTPTGKCEFWVVGVYWIDNFSKSAHVTLYGFESKEHCDMEGSVFKSRISFPIYNDKGQFDNYFNPQILTEDSVSPSTQFYKYIKENEANFSDAQDWINK